MNDNDHLIQIAHELSTQDSAGTAHPLFIVQQKRRVYGMDPNIDDIPFMWLYSDDYGYMFGDPEVFDEIRRDEGIATPDADIDPEEHGYEKLAYFEYWEFVNAHLTRRAADRYINENAHNLTDPRVYVSLQYHCPEWQAAIRHLATNDSHIKP